MGLGAFRGETSYDLLLWLHIALAIVGFGAVVLNGVYGSRVKTLAQAGKPGEAAAIGEANFFTGQIGEYAIYAVFLTGFLLALVGDDVWSLGDAWISASMGLFIVGVGIAHGVLIPASRSMNLLLREIESGGPPPAAGSGPPPHMAQMASLGQRLGTFGAVNNLLLALILYLMVFKPGA
jgi:hypothetical protein